MSHPMDETWTIKVDGDPECPREITVSAPTIIETLLKAEKMLVKAGYNFTDLAIEFGNATVFLDAGALVWKTRDYEGGDSSE